MAKRLQLEVPLHRGTRNYNPNTEPALQLDHLTLASSAVDLGTSHALAWIRRVGPG